MDSQQQQQQESDKTTTNYKILILGASYGSLLATKILMAGHDVTLICRESTAALFNQQGSIVLMPIKGGSDDELLEIRSKDLQGTLTACTPESILLESSTSGTSGSCSLLTSRFDLAVLAMQEPQYSAPDVRELVIRIAHDALPTMAITNMPLIPYLKRIMPNNLGDDSISIDSSSIRSCYTEPDLWSTTNFQNPGLLTQCSPDPQAFRPNADTQPNILQVRLPTNFKAAKFANPAHTQMLQRLEHDIEAARYNNSNSNNNQNLQIPVKLRVHDSLFVPLAKWAMLLTGNYRCVQPFPAEMVSIQHAVTSNLDQSRTVYDWVVQVCMDLGSGNDDNNNKASLDDFVPFEKYAAAAKSLTSPSSAARALAAGATNIERVDKLVLLLATQQGKEINATVMATVAAVDEWLAQNQNQKKKKKKQAAAAAEPASTK